MNRINIPEYKDLEKRILEIKSTDLSSVSIEEIKDNLKLLFMGYTLTTPGLSQGSILFRGIKYVDKPKSFEKLIYPPPEKAKIGRANREGISMFYCASDKIVPFYELDVKVGEKMVLSEWTTKRNIIVNNVGYTDNVFNKMGSIREIPFFATEKYIDDEMILRNRLVRNFLASTFCQKISDNETDKYKITNAISEKHFSENTQYGTAYFNGLLYPTIKMNAEADNIALDKRTVDNDYLNLEKVEYIEILNIKEDIYFYKIIDIAFNCINELINWENIPYHWICDTSDDIVIIKEDDSIQAFNYEGELIEPIKNKA